MSELSRSLSAEEFESGIHERILGTDLYVDRLCAIRFEFFPPQPNAPLERIELAVAVTALSFLDNHKTRVDFIIEVDRLERGRDNATVDSDVLDSDSIARAYGASPLRLYFSERTTGSWDNELAAIVDESLLVKH